MTEAHRIYLIVLTVIVWVLAMIGYAFPKARPKVAWLCLGFISEAAFLWLVTW